MWAVFALATIVLVGVQPSLMQVPPTCSRSIRTVLRPEPASAWESGTPAWPAPITTASHCCAAIEGDSFLTVLTPAAERPVEVVGRADEGEVREGLREVAQRLAMVSNLLGVEPEVVGITEHMLENKARFLEPASPRERLDEPEGAQAEGPFFARQAVRGLLHVVAVHEAVGNEASILGGAVDGIERLEHPGIAGRKEEDKGHDQVRGVQGVVVVGLHESFALRTPALLHDLLVDLVTDLQPLVAVGGKRALVGEPQTPVDGDPAHESGVHEVPAAAPGLPDPFVLDLPVVADPVDQGPKVGPQFVGDGGAVLVIEVDGIHQLAVDIELQLVVGAVSEPDGT